MKPVVLVIDFHAVDSCTCGSPVSLLALPLGSSSFLDRIAARVDRLSGKQPCELLVMPMFAPNKDYANRIHAVRPGARIVDTDSLAAEIERFDPHTPVTVFDPGCWPVDDFDLERMWRAYGGGSVATHLVGVKPPRLRARERVERDKQGRVVRVQRILDGSVSSEATSAGVFMTFTKIGALKDLRFRSASELRRALADRGHLSRDEPLAVDVIDLRKMDGVLTLNERMLRAEESKRKDRGNGIVIGNGCRVDRAARIVGPVILHDGVTVAAGATIVGPAVVGKNCELENGTIVAQSVLAAGTLVRTGVTLRHCIASGRCLACPEASAPYDIVRLSAAPASGPKIVAASQPAPSSRARRGESGKHIHFVLKRLMDIVAASLGLLILSPLLVVVAIAIKCTSRGPVFFVHPRERREGREFGCLKFRTMVADAHAKQEQLFAQNEVDGPQFKLRDDPRVTALGKWLRRNNIDELPQLVNVLLGHMSLVGPRPSPFRENQICVPWRRARLSVRPGITGLWQICRSPDRSAGDFHEWIFYDIAYVRHFTIWLDLRILIQTILTRGGRRSIPMSRLIPDESALAASAKATPTT